MIANGYNSQTIQPLQQLQPPQPLQTIKSTQPKQQASPEDKKRTNKCVQNFQDQLLDKSIKIDTVEVNRLIILITNNNINIYKSTISVHCPSLPTHKWLCVSEETFEKCHADIYLGYNPSTLQPEGFALRNQLFLTTEVPNKHEFGAPLYGIKRKALDPNIRKLFDLNYLLRNSQLESISYV